MTGCERVAGGGSEGGRTETREEAEATEIGGSGAVVDETNKRKDATVTVV